MRLALGIIKMLIDKYKHKRNANMARQFRACFDPKGWVEAV